MGVGMGGMMNAVASPLTPAWILQEAQRSEQKTRTKQRMPNYWSANSSLYNSFKRTYVSACTILQVVWSHLLAQPKDMFQTDAIQADSLYIIV
jgi:hypothetical protein